MHDDRGMTIDSTQLLFASRRLLLASLSLAGCVGLSSEEAAEDADSVEEFALSSDARLVSLMDFELQDTTAKFIGNSDRECFHDCAGGGFRKVVETTYADAFKVVTPTTGKVRAGSHGARLAIDSRLGYEEFLSENTGIGKPRVDLGNIGAAKTLEYHEDAWLGFSIYFPESHVFATGSNKFGVGLHEIQRAERNYCDAGGGPLGIGEVGDTFKLHVRYAASLNDCKNGIYERTSYALGKIPKGKWTDFVVHYQLCARPAMFGCTPYAQVWMNGELVADHKGPIGDAGTETGATKMTYKFDAPTYYAHHENTGAYDRPKGVYYIYADNVRLAKGKNAYELVDPSQGAEDPVDDSQFAALLGAPSINTGTEQKLFVWKADGKFTVLGSAGGSAVTYRGYIEADRVLTIANRTGIESDDTVRLIDGGKTLEFVLKVSGSGKDAFTFSAPSGATVRLDLTSHGAAKVRTGKDKQTISGLPLLLHAP